MAKIVQTLQDAGVKDKQISTDALTIDETSSESQDSQQLRKERKYRSRQQLSVTVPVSIAQSLVDVCIASGANDIGSPEWFLSDYDSAQAKVAGAALRKARLNAEQMANGLGAKLGSLVYASNYVPNPLQAILWGQASMNTSMASVSTNRQVKSEQQLKLFPTPVEVKATVHATFAIE